MTGSAPPRGFDDREFADRLDRAQRLMAQRGLAALLLTTEPEIRWFTGFLTQFWHSPTRPWFLIVPADGRPVAVIPEIGAPVMARTWVEDIRTWPAPVPADDGVTLLADTLRAIAGSGDIGVPMGPESTLRMPLADYDRVREALPTSAFVDASPLVVTLRSVKSAAEIAKLAEICRIASDTFDGVPALARIGRPLSTVFRDFKIALLTAGVDDVPYLVGASAPGGYEDVISPPGDQPLREGDILMMDTGAIRDGYFCDFDRNYALGNADEVSRRAYDCLYRATEAGLAAAVPGATCAALFGAMQAVIEGDGYGGGNVGRLGHGLGMQLTEWPSHTASDTTLLSAGMVLTLEPGLEMAPGRGMIHEENIVVREHGAELLGRRASPELPVIG